MNLLWYLLQKIVYLISPIVLAPLTQISISKESATVLSVQIHIWLSFVKNFKQRLPIFFGSEQCPEVPHLCAHGTCLVIGPWRGALCVVLFKSLQAFKSVVPNLPIFALTSTRCQKMDGSECLFSPFLLTSFCSFSGKSQGAVCPGPFLGAFEALPLATTLHLRAGRVGRRPGVSPSFCAWKK